jgi:hypothetical protein
METESRYGILHDFATSHHDFTNNCAVACVDHRASGKYLMPRRSITPDTRPRLYLGDSDRTVVHGGSGAVATMTTMAFVAADIIDR